MASTYLSLQYHIVFSTKDRRPFIDAENIRDLHGYLGGVVQGLGGIPEKIGGVADHVHLLLGLSATQRLSDFMRELKKASSVWMLTVRRVAGFAWQEGYAAFTVSAPSRAAVADYIARQEEHHRKRSFQEELVKMLEQAEVKYDERYLD